MGTGQIAGWWPGPSSTAAAGAALSQLLTGPGVGGTLVLCTEVTIARLSHSDHHTAVTPHQHSLIPDQAAQHQGAAGAVQDTLEK